ncbi:MAG: endo alpha-1,4 polygalactosaminidase [Magnetococcales bacterium]|nr:endo alpha-1,4 polygalactosaminidase [Magnetococcales bacterium]
MRCLFIPFLSTERKPFVKYTSILSGIGLLGVWLLLASPLQAGEGIWKPPLKSRFDWQLTEPFNYTRPTDVIDLDLFDAEPEQIAALKKRGVRLICYINVGAWEDWRSDKTTFPDEVLGNAYEGWAGERWLDIRNIRQLAPIMRARMDLCRDKGFDAIEPDNMDGHHNDTGFPLTAKDQLRYNVWLAKEAHARGLSIGLKNDSDQVEELIDHYDWALTEGCFHQKWCDRLTPFVKRGKAVFAVEYTDAKIDFAAFCRQARKLGLNGIMKKRNLAAWLRRCP